MRANTEQDFWDRVDVGQENDCWTWKGAVASDGSGRFGYQCKAYVAARLAFEFNGGTIGKDQAVAHRCSNHECVNPKHLMLVLLNEQLTRDTLTKKFNSHPKFTSVATPDSFWDRIDVGDPDECWWTSRDQISIDGKHPMRMYRRAWEMLNDLKWEGIGQCRRTCRNKKCANPFHLTIYLKDEGTGIERKLENGKLR